MLYAERARRARIGMAVVLAVVGICCFVRVLGFGFVYDDHWTIVENRSLERPLHSLLVSLATGNVSAIPDATRPSMVASIWLDRRLFGSDPSGYHADSLLLYGIACSAAGVLLLALTRRLQIALAGGIFFAAAPVHAEAVAAINYREDLIAAIAAMAVLAWVFCSRARHESMRAVSAFGALFLLGLFAKESAAGVVLVTLGLAAMGRRRAWFVERKKTFITLGVIVVLWGAWRLSLRLRGIDDVPLAEPTSFANRIFATARYEVQALLGSLAPVWWSPEYPPATSASAAWLMPFAALSAAAVGLATRRATRPVGVGLAFALLAALPTSPLIGPANSRADRFLFVSVLGGAMVWGWLAERVVLALRSRLARADAWSVLAVVSPLIIPLVVISQSAARAWRSDLALWKVASERAPGSYRSWVGLSSALRLSGDLDGAESSVERAIELFPRSRSAHVTRAYARLAKGDVAGARADIQRVRDLGGSRQRGLARAARCAELPPDRTRVCIEGFTEPRD